MQPSSKLSDLILLMRRLRKDCPWDQKQTNQTLLPYLLEESYELVDATHAGNLEEIKSELGDVLLQVVFHSELYTEQQAFDIGDVIYTLQEKLIRRHPHVFDKENLPDEAAVAQRWQDIKALENKNKPRRRLDAVNAGSGLMQADALQKTAASYNFDWDNIQTVLAQLKSEIAELEAAIDNQDRDNQYEEVGDCLFSVVNVARHLNIDSETALQQTNQKFRRRFGYIEGALEQRGTTPDQVDLDTLEQLWQAAKKDEKKY